MLEVVVVLRHPTNQPRTMLEVVPTSARDSCHHGQTFKNYLQAPCHPWHGTKKWFTQQASTPVSHSQRLLIYLSHKGTASK